MKVYWAISNSGDGSNSLHFSRKPFDGDRMEQEDPERWGSGDGFQDGSFEVDGTISGIRYWADEYGDDSGYYFLEETS